jgi:dienelactone hydrolase
VVDPAPLDGALITPGPALQLALPVGDVTAAVLVLPGGREHSFEPAATRQLAAVRMRPFAVALHRQGGSRGLAVASLRYRFRGWNGPDAAPLADTGWALDELRRRFGAVPTALLGHSMGGRVALRAAGDPTVRAVVALAPWLTADDPVEQLAGRRVVIAHGTLDRVTSPRASRRYADRAAAVADATYHPVLGDTHAMLLRYPTWQRLAVRAVLTVLPG